MPIAAADANRERRPAALRVARHALEGVCIAALALLVLITAIDVIGRYAFAAPLASAYPLARVLMALLVFAGLPLASAGDEHLRAGLFDAGVPRSLRRARTIAVHLVSAAACAGLAWRLAAQAHEYAANRELMELIELPLAPVVWVLAAFASASALAIAALALRVPDAAHAAARAR